MQRREQGGKGCGRDGCGIMVGAEMVVEEVMEAVDSEVVEWKVVVVGGGLGGVQYWWTRRWGE